MHLTCIIVNSVGRKDGGTTTLLIVLIVLESKLGTTRTPSFTIDPVNILLMAELVFFLRGESPVLLQWRTTAESGSLSCISCQVEAEPKGKMEDGYDSLLMRSAAVAAITAGSAAVVMMDERTVVDISSILSGRSSRKRSIGQSATVQSLAVLLQVSLTRC